MKRFLILMLLALTVLTVSAQRPIKYQVQRGETLSSIAGKFGMTERELKRLNDDLSYCYAGMTILVRDKRGGQGGGYAGDGYDDDRIDMDAPAAAGYTGDPLLDEARELEQQGRFKQAVKCYDKALERGPSASLFMQRGVCYFQMKKWKKAIDDFERVIRSNGSTPGMRRTCEDYLDEAYMQWERSKERKANTWAGIIGGVVAAGVVADALSSPGPGGGKGGPQNKGGKPGQTQGKQGGPQGKQGQQGGSPGKQGQTQGKQGGKPGQGGNRGQSQAKQGGSHSGGGQGGNRGQGQGGNRGQGQRGASRR